MRALVLVAASLAAIAVPAVAGAVTYRTATHSNGPSGDTVQSFGPAPGATPTYGQVFVSPRGGILDSFTFSLGGSVGQIRAGVGKWTGPGNPVPGGSVSEQMWESTFVPSSAGTMTFTPGVQIFNQTKYVAYITVFDSPDAAGSTFLLLGDNDDSALRYFTYDNGTGDPGAGQAWINSDLNYGDALFSFSVTTVPEPAEWTLMILGFGLTGAVVRRRRSGLTLVA